MVTKEEMYTELQKGERRNTVGDITYKKLAKAREYLSAKKTPSKGWQTKKFGKSKKILRKRQPVTVMVKSPQLVEVRTEREPMWKDVYEKEKRLFFK